MPNILAYRVGYVHRPQLPLDRVAALGIRYLEIVMAPDETTDSVLAALAPHGLQVSTVHAPTPLEDEAALYAGLEDYCARARRLGAQGLFVSAKAGALPLEEAVQRLQRCGEIAATGGLFIALETHPDLAENGDNAAATLAAVDHPAVGWNLDPANISYYNENGDAVAEARKAARFVRSVHAKDTNGGFKDHAFPNVGEGIVDFAALGAVLAEAGFTGPYTLEWEGDGKQIAPLSVEQMEANLAAGVTHLRKLGLVE